MLLVSSRSFVSLDAFEDGLDDALRNVLRGLASLGGFGAVNGENPDGGLEVLITGGLAANSSRDPSSCASCNDGRENAP